MAGPPYHGRTHLPGGTDPIPGFVLLPDGGGVSSIFAASEAFVTLTNVNWWQGVMARVQPAGPGEAGGAYTFAVNNTDAGIWAGIATDGNVSDQLGSQVTITPPTNGDKIGITIENDEIKGWIYSGGSWSNVITRTDSTWESGHLGLWQTQLAGIFDDFGGGVISETPGDFDSSILDPFNRDDEDPLYGAGNWAQRTTTPLRLVGNAVTQSGVVNTYSAGYWTPTAAVEEGDLLAWGPDGPVWSDPDDLGLTGGAASTDSRAWMPLTTVVGGVPELVWDGDDQLIPTITDI